MRQLVSYGQWMVPVSDAAAAEMLEQGSLSRVMFSKDPEGVCRLFIFTDGDAYNRFTEIASGEIKAQTFLTTAGTWVFRMPTDGIDFIAIDPGSPHDIAYGKEHFAKLKRIADAIEVERALADLRSGDTTKQGLIPTVRDYPRYIIPIRKTAEGNMLGLAPDDKGRALAAIFTNDDAFDAYLGESESGEPESMLVRLDLSGQELFAQISKMGLDGIVFNCCGPVKPVAFARQFAEVMVSANE